MTIHNCKVNCEQEHAKKQTKLNTHTLRLLTGTVPSSERLGRFALWDIAQNSAACNLSLHNLKYNWLAMPHSNIFINKYSLHIYLYKSF